jgi:hypothetical protein
MKYKTPELTALTPAINAVQGIGTPKLFQPSSDSGYTYEMNVAYSDWED